MVDTKSILKRGGYQRCILKQLEFRPFASSPRQAALHFACLRAFSLLSGSLSALYLYSTFITSSSHTICSHTDPTDRIYPQFFFSTNMPFRWNEMQRHIISTTSRFICTK